MVVQKPNSICWFNSWLQFELTVPFLGEAEALNQGSTAMQCPPTFNQDKFWTSWGDGKREF